MKFTLEWTIQQHDLRYQQLLAFKTFIYKHTLIMKGTCNVMSVSTQASKKIVLEVTLIILGAKAHFDEAKEEQERRYRKVGSNWQP